MNPQECKTHEERRRVLKEVVGGIKRKDIPKPPVVYGEWVFHKEENIGLATAKRYKLVRK